VIQDDLGIEQQPVLASRQNPDEIQVDLTAADIVPGNIKNVLIPWRKEATTPQNVEKRNEHDRREIGATGSKGPHFLLTVATQSTRASMSPIPDTLLDPRLPVPSFRLRFW
jgi:hypothetical protein